MNIGSYNKVSRDLRKEGRGFYYFNMSNGLEYALLSRDASDGLVGEERVGRYGYYEPGYCYWSEPLALVAYAAANIGKSREARHAYECFIAHLEEANAASEGTRACHILDAERTLRNLLGESTATSGPEYPLDSGYMDDLRKLVSDNPGLLIVVFAGPEGSDGVYCGIDRVEVTQALNLKTHWRPFATDATSRSELVGVIENEIRDIGCVEGFGPDWNDERITAAAEEEVAKFDDDWIPVIAIRAK